jgi:hypothetical protein
MDKNELTDVEFLQWLRERGELTPVELQLVDRLERALDEVDALTHELKEARN